MYVCMYEYMYVICYGDACVMQSNSFFTWDEIVHVGVCWAGGLMSNEFSLSYPKSPHFQNTKTKSSFLSPITSHRSRHQNLPCALRLLTQHLSSQHLLP